MADPNPKNLNVPNEGVPEEEPHHLLDFEKEDPEMEIEEEEPEEELVEESEPLPGHGDQFDAHPNPQPGNMNGWVDDDDDDDEEEEDEENEDANIEEDDDAEIIFPYEVQCDQTPPPRDESSDSDSEPEAEEADNEPEAKDADDELEVEEAGVEPEAEGADVELEAEEPDGVPEAAIGAGSQMPFAIRDFPTGVYEIGESSTTRDPYGAGRSGGASGSGRAGGPGGTGGNADGTGVRGARPTAPELTRCTYATFIKCDPLPFNGTEGAVVRLAYQLAGQLIQDKADEVTEGEKRK
nr:hypothetical protein [Tanacetum cinerariifolium]